MHLFSLYFLCIFRETSMCIRVLWEGIKPSHKKNRVTTRRGLCELSIDKALFWVAALNPVNPV
ncbi:hypothetical protein SBDP1_1150001 [Syntrophobacter sp. SbD1]|nr:hypothetical protein SBDP1_1150001 [Syntrophobacter sp. SbD1]